MQMQFLSINKNFIFNLVAAIEITELEELLKTGERRRRQGISRRRDTKDLEQIMNEVDLYLN